MAAGQQQQQDSSTVTVTGPGELPDVLKDSPVLGPDVTFRAHPVTGTDGETVIREIEQQLDTEIMPGYISNRKLIEDHTISVRSVTIRNSTDQPDWSGKSNWYTEWSAARWLKVLPDFPSREAAEKTISANLYAFSQKTGRAVKVPTAQVLDRPTLPKDPGTYSASQRKKIAAEPGGPEKLTEMRLVFLAAKDRDDAAAAIMAELGNEVTEFNAEGEEVTHRKDPGDVKVVAFSALPEAIRNGLVDRAIKDRKDDRTRESEKVNSRVIARLWSEGIAPVDELVRAGLKPPAVKARAGANRKPKAPAEPVTIDLGTVDATVKSVAAGIEKLDFRGKIQSLQIAEQDLSAFLKSPKGEKLAGEQVRDAIVALKQHAAACETIARQLEKGN